MAVLLPLAAACGSSGGKGGGPATPTVAAGQPGAPRIGALTPTDPSRLPATESAAIAALAEVAVGDAPSSAQSHGHAMVGPQPVTPLSGLELARFDEQWMAARKAVAGLDTPEEASAAGYVRAAANGPGVGVHWVKWSLITKPFDPAAPAMLLFDERGARPVLAGFSYWLHSEREPEGFVGPDDHWHQHTGLCVVNGWVDREESAGPTACAGHWFGGADLWMLHAWVVPGWTNRWGPFTVMNPRLCPAAVGTPDVARCPAKDESPI